MITKNQIIRFADADDVPAPTVERDYILTHTIAGMSMYLDDARIVFKGGTAIRLCFIEDYRYSADLDFSLMGLTASDAVSMIGGTLDRVRDDLGLPALGLTSDDPPRISYVGPLGRERFVKLDIADDELVENTRQEPLVTRYPDLQSGVSTEVYTLTEIAAEKLRCVIQRVQCRDLYDLHELLESYRAVDLIEAWPLFERKARHKEIDPMLFAERFRSRLRQYEQRWNRELENLVQDEAPHFEEVSRRVRRHLRAYVT